MFTFWLNVFLLNCKSKTHHLGEDRYIVDGRWNGTTTESWWMTKSFLLYLSPCFPQVTTRPHLLYKNLYILVLQRPLWPLSTSGTVTRDFLWSLVLLSTKNSPCQRNSTLTVPSVTFSTTDGLPDVKLFNLYPGVTGLTSTSLKIWRSPLVRTHVIYTENLSLSGWTEHPSQPNSPLFSPHSPSHCITNGRLPMDSSLGSRF